MQRKHDSDDRNEPDRFEHLKRQHVEEAYREGVGVRRGKDGRRGEPLEQEKDTVVGVVVVAGCSPAGMTLTGEALQNLRIAVPRVDPP